MNIRRVIPLTARLILTIVLAASSLALPDVASEKDAKAEQNIQNANDLRKAADYAAAIAE